MSRVRARRVAPYERWDRVSLFVQLAAVSSRISNAEAPVNLLLCGPPGDGKTKMIMRVKEHAPHVSMLSDATYTGLIYYLETVRDNMSSTLVIPDLGTLVGRKLETAKQSIATLAMMCAEGVGELRVGKQVRDYHFAKASVISAITLDDVMQSYNVVNQNAFLSRVFLIDFDLEWSELQAMMDRKLTGDRSRLQPFPFPKVRRNRDGTFKRYDVQVPKRYLHLPHEWWRELRQIRRDRFFGFRSADAFMTLLMASAYLRGAKIVTRQDVQNVMLHVLPLVRDQIQFSKNGG
jgi:hypothetical protein